jgi:hypothetical protein
MMMDVMRAEAFAHTVLSQRSALQRKLRDDPSSLARSKQKRPYSS